MDDDEILEYEWSIDTSGKLEDVIAAVEAAQPLPYKRLVGKPVVKKTNAAGDAVKTRMEYKEKEVTPNEVDVADFELAQTAILEALAAQRAEGRHPFAGVCARFRPNRDPLGGYELNLSIAAYDRLE
jgi:hypothetical protein